MTRTQRLLIVAVALSLLVHLIVALIVRPFSATTQNQAEVVSIERRATVIAMTKMPTPPPRPRHTPAPRAPASARPVARKGPAGAQSPGGGAAGVAPARPTPTPLPVATTASSACTQPNAGAAVVASPPPPDIPTAVRASATNGTAVIKVDLDPSGQVAGAGVAQSTGNSSLDLVAVAMARGATYSPPLHDCKPIAGAYNFSVKFVAW